ncbi:tyrosine-protein phosphatase [Agromyces sp. S2-1-8]|uniref:tyrosine-protein phosphatase n=1 Tax=Agromyces sp. S2-1-8 TaxID=2897180 RepID=UPI001E552659|nr:tyrosine-protein phosphatase [Agromyces sp. S2-1-8]MCD5345314.1 tyrosine-protein phosphatase [Agromyces sp. S2-1-8]
MTRRMTWAGLPNTWDLGGLDGALGTTRHGRIYRSAMLDGLGEAGRSELYDNGVRTIIDLRNDDEVGRAIEEPFTRHHRPVEDQSNTEFMARWETLDSPGYYAEVLERWPELIVAVFDALAGSGGPRDSRPGALLLHCAHGRDRTGMITSMLLQLCEVDRTEIVADYLGAVHAIDAHERLAGDASAGGRTVSPAEFEVLNERRVRELDEFLDGLDVAGYLVANGFEADGIDRVRARLLA